jgi:hypothetical protein
MVLTRVALAACSLSIFPLFSQQVQAPRTVTTTGVVRRATASTLIIKPEGQPQVLFVIARETVRPGTIPVGAIVRVVSAPDEENLQIARSITVVTPPKPGALPEEATEPIAPEIRDLERQISRQVRRYGVGVRAGVALDPELVLIGAHARLGPFFQREFSFRPSVELGFGEVTTLAAFNLEGVYRLPLTLRQGRWSSYAGAGIGLNLTHRSFEALEDSGATKIDFGDWDYDSSLNIFGGIEFRNGAFVELKASAYGGPSIRLIFGYNF